MSLLHTLAIRRARRDPVAFAALLGRDEATGDAIRMADIHREYHRLLDHPKAVVIAPPETGKSAQGSLRLAWEMGTDPSLCCAIVSGTAAQASRHLTTVANIIAHPLYREVFPGIEVERQTQDALWLTGRPNARKDQNRAFDMSSLLGTRLDLVLADDIVTRESTRTQSSRDRAYLDCVGILGGRLSPRGRFWVLNTAEHSDDVPHRLGRLPGWVFKSFPLLDENGFSRWPERWPVERVEARRLELGPSAFRRLMACQPVDEATQVFHEALITQAMAQGVVGLGHSPVGGRCIVGVDPAWSTSSTADESGIVLVTVDDAGFRHVVHVEGMRVNSDVLVARVGTLARVNRASIYIESNSGGMIVGEQLKKLYPHVTLLHTSASSKAARVEWLSGELAAGRWALRNFPGVKNAQLEKLCDDLLSFSFEGHMGDRLSALLLAVEGTRKFESRPKARGWFHFTPPQGGSSFFTR